MPRTDAGFTIRISAAVIPARRLRSSAEIAPALAQFGYETKITTPAEFAAFFASELRKWPPVLTAAGLKAQ